LTNPFLLDLAGDPIYQDKTKFFSWEECNDVDARSE
jgi:hypothetical protein